jgi:hypothetical protein
MKISFIKLLVFFSTIHFILPMVYYKCCGFIQVYGKDIVNEETVSKAFWINTITLLCSSLIIYIFGKNEGRLINPKYYNIDHFFYLIILFQSYTYVQGGGFEEIISGSINGSLISYINQLINPVTIYAFVLYFQVNKYNIYLLTGFLVGYLTMTGSRSAVIQVLIITIIFFPLFKNFNIYLNQIKRIIFICILLSPLIYIAASMIREIDINAGNIIVSIMGRISLIELSMIPIDCVLNNSINCNLEIFYEKYNFIRQLKLSIDTLYPGFYFIDDVFPNQYYRSAFMGVNTEFAQSNYMSINTTLPSYFYMYSNEYIAVIISSFTIILYFLLMQKNINNDLIILPMIICLYQYLYGFDFVYFISQLYTSFASLLIVLILLKIRFIIRRFQVRSATLLSD